MRLLASNPTDKGVELLVGDCTADEAAQALSTFFLGIGFAHSRGSLREGVYEVGDPAGRLFIGAFAKRAKFNVRVQPTDRGVSVSVVSGMSGMSGGAIGVMKEGKQRKQLAADLQAYFGSASASAAPATVAVPVPVASAPPPDPALPTRPCPHCSQAFPCTAQQCPACGGTSPAWLLHEGRWWTRDAAGALYWHDPATNAWIPYAAQTA
jgi:hypothetical protein